MQPLSFVKISMADLTKGTRVRPVSRLTDCMFERQTDRPTDRQTDSSANFHIPTVTPTGTLYIMRLLGPVDASLDRMHMSGIGFGASHDRSSFSKDFTSLMKRFLDQSTTGRPRRKRCLA